MAANQGTVAACVASVSATADPLEHRAGCMRSYVPLVQFFSIQYLACADMTGPDLRLRDSRGSCDRGNPALSIG
jgi:hypothetical protein